MRAFYHEISILARILSDIIAGSSETWGNVVFRRFCRSATFRGLNAVEANGSGPIDGPGYQCRQRVEPDNKIDGPGQLYIMVGRVVPSRSRTGLPEQGGRDVRIFGESTRGTIISSARTPDGFGDGADPDVARSGGSAVSRRRRLSWARRCRAGALRASGSSSRPRACSVRGWSRRRCRSGEDAQTVVDRGADPAGLPRACPRPGRGRHGHQDRAGERVEELPGAGARARWRGT